MKSFCLLVLIFLILPFSGIKVSASSLTPDGSNKVTITLESKTLKVTLDKSFPAAIRYTQVSGGQVIYGQEDPLTQVKINEKLYTPKITSVQSKGQADYTLELSDIGVVIKIKISVAGNIVEFAITQIIENGAFKVSSIEIPNHYLLSIRSTQLGATFAGSNMYTAVKGTGDVFQPLTGEVITDSLPKDFLYGILHTDQLAASLWTNSVNEKSDNNRIQKQTIKKDGYYQTGIWSGPWVYRAQGMTSADPLPTAKIIITTDANDDQKIDWQDGAIAFREIMNNPPGSEKIPDLVVQRIPMNFASQATNPFLKTLDETKRIYLNTDGLGQFVILKGYGSEGHDSKHPDYGDIGKRQGGAAEMELLCRKALKYNAFMGVHINGTESYPEAVAFDDSLVNKNKRGWDWLDASYYIDKRYDATSNKRLLRLKSLKDQVPSLKFIYCDVWYARGSWDSRKLAREIHSLGLTLATEFPTDHEYDAVWNHWAVDYDYGGKTIKGFNSQIVRFIRNHLKDTWVARHPLLGGAEMKDFEGWQGRIDFDSCINMTFQTDLPAKYLQHFKIMKWTNDRISFTGQVSSAIVNGERVITKNGRVILNGDAYLLPWNPQQEEKLYHWNAKGGATNWELPEGWKSARTVELYKLTDQGRVFVKTLTVLTGSINLEAEAGKPYVIYRKKMPQEPISDWGEGTPVKDPGFNSESLRYWKIEGTGAKVERNLLGQNELVIRETSPVTVSQVLNGLEPGSYYASVYVSTGSGRKAYLGIKNPAGEETSIYSGSSLWTNYIAADSKHDTKMQRMYLYFKVPEGQPVPDLFLRAGEGSSPVTFDDVRVVRNLKPETPDSIYFREDFENIPDGLYPFVKGPSGGVNDPRTHLSELHAPYTQKGWNGKPVDDVIRGNWSLKAHGEPAGLLLQTIPQTIPFVAGKTYTVTFSYEASGSDYALVTGDGTSIKASFTLNAADLPTLATVTFVAGDSGESWFGIEKLNDRETDLIIDDLIIIEKK